MKKTRMFLTMMIFVAAIAAVLPIGCMSATEKEFHAADCAVIAQYLTKAQPAVEAYCDAAKDEQLRTDTRALAAEMAENTQARLDRMKADQQVIEAAQAALNTATAVLDEYEAIKKEDSTNGE